MLELTDRVDGGEPSATLTLPLEKRKCGGLGIHLVRTFSDTYNYERRDEKNVLKLEKQIEKESR